MADSADQKDSSAGWVATCQDCDLGVGGYGEKLLARKYFDITDDRGSGAAHSMGMIWAVHHTDQHPGHTVTVNRYATQTFKDVQISQEAMRDLFGFPTDPPPPG